MKPVVLVVLDGWGYRKARAGNAIALAKTPNYDSLLKKYSHARLKASGRAVGLQVGVVGNSQVGHQTMGAGRMFPSDLLRINQAIKNGSFFRNNVLLNAMRQVKRHKRSLHLMGLLSDGNVHSNISHLFALLKMAKKQKLERVFVHAILDGVDTSKSGEYFIRLVLKKMKQLGVGEIATVIGRYYAMDRDFRWARTHTAYKAIVNEEGAFYESAIDAVRDKYKKSETDRFMKPCVIHCKTCVTEHVVIPGDVLIFFNFRSDRARQLTCSFTCEEFDKFRRIKYKHLHFASLTEYDEHVKNPVAFSPIKGKNLLSEWVGKHGLRQLKIAESEKYPHLTFFFNNGRNEKFKGEDWIHVETGKIKKFEKFPKMKAKKIADEAVKAINGRKYDLVMINFANGDMLGHTGNLGAAKKGVKELDRQLGRVVNAVEEVGGACLITADHGNVEVMIKNGKKNPSHTANDVPVILVSKERRKIMNGSLVDVAATLLDLLELKKPAQMTGKSLLR